MKQSNFDRKTISISGYIILIFLLTIVSLAFFFNKASAEESKSVIFNELFWTGSFISSSDEFIELKNISDKNINLSGWQITKTDSSGNEVLMISIPSGIVPANGYFLIANSEKDHLFSKGESILNIDSDLVSSSLTLSNDNLQLKIYNGNWNDGRLALDVAGNGKKPLAGNNTTKASMNRIEPVCDGNLVTSWQTTNSSKNIDAGSLELATPQPSGKPIINKISPDQISIQDNGNALFIAEVYDPDGIVDIKSVSIDLSSLGISGLQKMEYDDGVYGYSTNSGSFLKAGDKIITVIAEDKKGLITESTSEIEVYQLSNKIIINEILPQPNSGSEDEFIELYNQGNKSVDLFGWQIDDIANGGSKPFIIPEGYSITNGGYIVFNKKDTGIALNNDGDEVRLTSPDGQYVNIVSNYQKAKENYSYNLFENEWKWSTTVTAGSKNVFTEPISTSNSNSKGATKSESGPLSVSIFEAKSLKDNTQVSVEGIVSVIPGVLSTQYFYIQDAQAGIEIYCYHKLFPDLQVGDRIRVNGEISTTSLGNRINISYASDIEILDHNQTIEPIPIKINEASDSNNNQLIEISGIVSQTSGNIFYLDDGTGIIRVYINKLTKIDKPRLEKGYKVQIIGILTKYKNGWQILPRFQSDFFLINSKDPPASAAKSNSIISIAHASDSNVVGDENNGNVLGSNIKAKETDNSLINRERLIKTLETIIIISTILLILLIGKRYVENDNKKSK